jgi:hypothetical protein
MQTTDQVIDEILLKSPYGAKAYEARLKRQREVELKEDENIDHPQQTYLNFEKDNHE